MTFRNEELITEMNKLQRFARKLCRNEHDAEDLLQATVLKALEKKDMFKEGTSLFSWTSKIMYNDFVSSYRRKVKFETQYDCEELIANQANDSRQEKMSELSQINEAMDLLSDEHKTILICVCVKDMKYQEVADMLAIPVGTVRSRLSRAREQLQEALTRRAAERKIQSAPPSFAAFMQKAA